MGNLWIVIACLIIGLNISLFVLVPNQTTVDNFDKYSNNQTVTPDSILSQIGARMYTSQGLLAFGTTAGLITVAVITGSVLGAFLVILALFLFVYSFFVMPIDVYTGALPGNLGSFIVGIYNFLIIVAVIDFLKDW